MAVFVSIFTFLLVLVVLVVAHELGHFLTAKARGVRVMEFGIGFPPRILGIKKGDTIYSINALPLGGFVKLAGEEDPRVAGSLASKGYGTRLLVLSAGSLMNLLLPIVILSVAFMVPHNVYTAPVVIQDVAENSPAAAAGILPGDTVISVNGNTLNNSSDLQRHIQLNLGKEIDIMVKHADSTVETVQVTSRWKPPQGEGSIGVLMASAAGSITVESVSEPIWRAVPMGAEECYQTLVLFKNEIIRWFIGASAPQLTGPVGIAELTGEVVESGFSPLLEFSAFLSINLGIINLLPLPALDGGRIVLVLLEMIRGGRRVSAKVEGYIHLVGFTLLIALMVLVTYSDIFNIITTGSAIPMP